MTAPLARPKTGTWIALAVSIGILLLAGAYIAFNHHQASPGRSMLDRFIAEPLELAFDEIDPLDSLDRYKASHADIQHTCYHEENNQFGDYVCWAPISRYDGIRAVHVAAFFREEVLSTIRITVPSDQHVTIFGHLKAQFGDPRPIPRLRDASGGAVIGWDRRTGVVALSQNVPPGADSAVYWFGHGTPLGTQFSAMLANQEDGEVLILSDAFSPETKTGEGSK